MTKFDLTKFALARLAREFVPYAALCLLSAAMFSRRSYDQQDNDTAHVRCFSFSKKKLTVSLMSVCRDRLVHRSPLRLSHTGCCDVSAKCRVLWPGEMVNAGLLVRNSVVLTCRVRLQQTDATLTFRQAHFVLQVRAAYL